MAGTDQTGLRQCPYFTNADLLIAADCTAYAYGDFHQRFIRGRITLVGCPKLDEGDYTEKLAAIIANNSIKKHYRGADGGSMRRRPAAGSGGGAASQRQEAAFGCRGLFLPAARSNKSPDKNFYLTSGLSSAERPLACNHTLCAHVQKGKKFTQRAFI